MAEKTPLAYRMAPETIDEYVGQDKIKENLKIFIEAAKLQKKVILTYYID